MTTGAFWNVENPDKPWGPLDPDDAIIIPFDFSEWLAGQGTAYASHNLTPAAGLDAVTVSTADGVILVRVSPTVDVQLEVGEKYGVTCQVVAADTQKRSMTLYFKIKEL